MIEKLTNALLPSPKLFLDFQKAISSIFHYEINIDCILLIKLFRS